MFRPLLLAALLAATTPVLFAAEPPNLELSTSGAPFVAPQTTRATLLADVAAIAPGAKFRVALTLEHAAHKHSYWQNPGAAGTTTEVTWDKTAGATFSPWRFPAPTLLKQAGLLAFVHEGRTRLVTEVTAPASAKPGDTLTLAGLATWLECDDRSCLPGESPVSLTLPVANTSEPAHAAEFAEADMHLPALPPVAAGLVATAAAPDTATVIIPAAALAGRDLTSARLFPLNDGLPADQTQPLEFTAAQPEPQANGDLHFTLPHAGTTLKAKTLAGVVTFATGKPLALVAAPPVVTAAPLVVAPASAPIPANSLALTLLLAFGGGLLLNIMPCVFPVLGLKIYGFVAKANGDARAAFRHGLAFAAGIVVSFWILAGALIALRGAAAKFVGAAEGELGWGFLQQMPGFNLLVAALFLVMALGMYGVFEFGTGVQNAAGNVRERSGLLGSFLSGALATLVATPCSGPGMAPAIGFALNASPGVAFLIFTVMATGLALPFVILSASPALLAKLPRPGAWMESFKQGLSFLLFGSFAYFTWILSGQLDEQPMLLALFAFTAIAFACWIYGRWCVPAATTRVRRIAYFTAAFIVGAAVVVLANTLPHRTPGALAAPGTTTPNAVAINWGVWSPEAQAAALAEGKTVYVDFTARWCLTCQTNKHVYHNDDVIRAFADHGIVALKADWGNRSATIAAELKKYGRATIPFNVVLRRDRDPAPLPALLTDAAVIEAVSGK